MNTNKIHALGLAIALTATLGVSGCASNKPLSSSGNVVRDDASVEENLTNEISTNNFNEMAKAMTDSLVTSTFARNSPQKPITVTISEVKNKTSEHIDTRTITNKIESQLLNSGLFDPGADRGSENELAQLEIQRQTQSGEYKASKSVKAGVAEGARYMLFGEISSIVKRAGDIKNITYTLQLKLLDVQTKKKVWADEKEIRKTSERSTF
jgi:uncharacterized protein (TIGR02722 family)